MKRLIQIALMLAPVICFSQVQPTFQIEVDPYVAITGGKVSEPSLDYTLAIGIDAGRYTASLAYENFLDIGYQALEVRNGIIFNEEGIVNYSALIGLGWIHRDVAWIPQDLHLKGSLNGQAQWNLTELFSLTLRLESAYRGELKQVINSAYAGIKFTVL